VRDRGRGKQGGWLKRRETEVEERDRRRERKKKSAHQKTESLLTNKNGVLGLALSLFLNSKP
jgi:hypothetical protein